MKEHIVHKSMVLTAKVIFTALIFFSPDFLLHICFKVSRGELCCSSVRVNNLPSPCSIRSSRSL